MLTEKEKMIKGLNYDQFDPELSKRRAYVRKQLMKINHLDNKEQISTSLANLFASSGKGLFVETGIEFDYGFNIKVGNDFYANYHLTLLDTCPITIGDNCYFGPDVGLYTPVHPIDPVQRKADVELGRPITIGNNVWMGGHVTILPGVTLGNNVVVGAGSVVTKSFGDNVVVVGSPARVIKKIKK